MVDRRRPRYHIGDQEVSALLPPIVAALGEIEARLSQYADRLHMSDADRSRVAAARDAVGDARTRVDRILVQSPPNGG